MNRRFSDNTSSFFSAIDKLRHFGFSKEKLHQCRAAMNAHNAGGLSVASLVAAALIFFLSFYPGGNDHIESVYYAFAGLQLLIFAYSQIFLNKILKKTFHHFFGIVLFTLNIICFALYICIFDFELYAVRFLLFFFVFEVIFIFDPLLTVMYNVGIVTIFSLSYRYAEFLFGVTMPKNSFYDILNIIASSAIAMALNWYISRVFIKGLVTSTSLEEERNRYHEESIHDQLTGLNNRRSFEQSVSFYTSVCRHVHQTVCIIMLDIDFFKKYNDHYGHQKGDMVLQSVGNVLKQLIREEKVYAARVGGEEFIVLWTENRTSEAERVALKLRQMIINMSIPHAWSQAAPYITASLGLYIMRGGSQDSSEELYNAADSALYKAKEAGRNCVVRYDSADRSYAAVELRDHTEAGR